jgi:DNA polymerase-3 subunit alpha
MSTFVHLSVHSEYSLVDSIVRVKPLVAAARDAQMPAIAITDYSSVAAIVKLYRAAIRAGVKPVFGADVRVVDDSGDGPSRMILLCRNTDGFRALSRLLTRSGVEGRATGQPLIHRRWLEAEDTDGLIALSGGMQGEPGRLLVAGHSDLAKAAIESWMRLFPDRYYVELHRLGLPQEQDYVQSAVALAARCGAPVVATNDVRFIERSDFEAHETRVCIAQGHTLNDARRTREYTEEQYLKSADEMAALFADIPEALENSVEIARRCTLELDLGRVFMPSFEVAEGKTTAQHLREVAQAGLERHLQRAGLLARRQSYDERLERELDVIIEMGFEGYFLIVADFIDWSRAQAVPVGPGRGSGAGSLVAFSLGITNLDPIEHDLLFERFLNPERVSMPDFDIDFCIEGRDRVIGYVAEKYGRERVSQIITYGTMAAKAVVRDVGRVLGMPYGYVDRIAKLIPNEIGITLEQALAGEEELRTLYETEDEVSALLDLAMQLEGLARNAGTHAGGVVIAPSPLTDFMPLFVDEAGTSLSQFDKDDLEAVGLVKFDFLGLKTLTIVDRAVATVNDQRAAAGDDPVNLDDIPFDDPKTYQLLNTCRTTAVFQLESRGMRDLIKRLKPDCFDDLVAILALFRPGPLQSGMVDEFIERKHARGDAKIDYLHPRLKPALQSTYGVILYQEQVMQIAQILAGYSLGGADLLRRAMGKKKPEEMAKQRSIFQSGAEAREIPAAQARRIFDLMEKFAGYGFNKSHSAAYALIAYHTAWLKAHYPAAFMAAAMSADIDNTDKLVILREECAAIGIELIPPHVNHSNYLFTVADERQVKYGLGAVKGVGRGVVDSIVEERAANGPYKGLLDLCRRLGSAKLNRRVLEALVRCGALDGLGLNRASAMHAISDAIRLADTSQAAAAAGQAGLFGTVDEAGDGLEHAFEHLREWNDREKLEAERESLGLYLTGHPFTDYADHCSHFTSGSIAGVLGTMPNVEGGGDGPGKGARFRYRRDATLAGVVMDIRRRGTRVSLVLDDGTERIEVTLFEDVFQQARNIVSKHAVLVVNGQLRFDEFLNGWRMTAQRVQTVDAAIERHARRLTLFVPSTQLGDGFVDTLKATLQPYRSGDCEVCVQYRGAGAEATITLGDQWAVHPTRELREQLSELVGEKRVSMHYARQTTLQ